LPGEHALSLAFALRDLGRVGEALEVLVGAEEEGPHPLLGAELMSVRGELLYLLGRHEEALTCLEQSRADRPGYPWTYQRLGGIYHALGDFERERRIGREAVARWPRNPQFLVGLADGLRSHFRAPGEAVELYRRALAVDPDHEGAVHQLAHALEELGQPREAIAAYRRALALDPSSQHLASDLGLLLLDSDEPDEAREGVAFLTDLAGRTSGDPTVMNSLAWAKVKDPTAPVFDPETAVHEARRAVALLPDSAALTNTLGYALYWLEEWAELAEVSGRSLELGEDDPYADDAYLLAAALHHTGRSEEARAALERARELAAGSAVTPELERLVADVEGLFRDE
jgi:tetratricopeptide (TPR) repeat protein